MAQVLKDSVRERILLAAERCFAREGARRATMGGIAEEAGVATGSIYTYFPNKQALFEAVVPEEFVREFQRLTRRRIADFEQPGAFMPGFEPGLANPDGFDGSAGPAGPLGPTGPADPASSVSLSKPAAPVGAVSLFKPGAPVSRVLSVGPAAPVGARLAESAKAANIVLPAAPAAAVTPGPDGSGDPLDPAAHVGSADADDDTPDSTNSIDPIGPLNPTGPIGPIDSTGPVDPGEASDPGGPSGPIKLTDSGDPNAPSDPSDPSDPSALGGPIDPSAPDELSAPGEPSGPTGPTCPSAPNDPARGNSKLPAQAASARGDSKPPAQAADARTASYAARAAVPETPESTEVLLRFWLANRLRTVILLDRAEGTRREAFGREYVQEMLDQALEQAERQFPGLMRDELFRFLARRTLAESVRGMVAILERYEDEATLRQAFAAATACRLAAIQALVAWSLARRSE